MNNLKFSHHILSLWSFFNMQLNIVTIIKYKIKHVSTNLRSISVLKT